MCWYILEYKVKQINLKPIFHWKLRSRWLPNANEIDTNNIKYTCPTRAPMPGDPMQPIFHWLALGLRAGDIANFSDRVVGNTNFSVFYIPTCWYSQHKILDPQPEDPTRVFLHRSVI